jgi:hypothetical protein
MAVARLGGLMGMAWLSPINGYGYGLAWWLDGYGYGYGYGSAQWLGGYGYGFLGDSYPFCCLAMAPLGWATAAFTGK